MAYTVTAPTSFEQISRYFKEITAEFERLQARFPADVNVAHMWKMVYAGERRLWLVLDGDRFVSAMLTEMKAIDATGLKTATLIDMAGTEAAQSAEDICGTLEEWAKAEGAKFAQVFGREGWDRYLKQRGYRKHAVVWRKEIA